MLLDRHGQLDWAGRAVRLEDGHQRLNSLSTFVHATERLTVILNGLQEVKDSCGVASIIASGFQGFRLTYSVGRNWRPRGFRFRVIPAGILREECEAAIACGEMDGALGSVNA